MQKNHRLLHGIVIVYEVGILKNSENMFHNALAVMKRNTL